MRPDGVRIVVLVEENSGDDQKQYAEERQSAEHVCETVRRRCDGVVELMEGEALANEGPFRAVISYLDFGLRTGIHLIRQLVLRGTPVQQVKKARILRSIKSNRSVACSNIRTSIPWRPKPAALASRPEVCEV